MKVALDETRKLKSAEPCKTMIQKSPLIPSEMENHQEILSLGVTGTNLYFKMSL